jgi:thiosulfate reductase cytochrome b subunit
VPDSAAAPARVEDESAPRHSSVIRITHWVTAFCFLALLVSGIEIVISHPRFYWGETGNVLTVPLFVLPIPASRQAVPTGYGFVLADQNGWSRYLHFQTAWIVVLTGFVYVASGLFTRHFRKNLLPSRGDLAWPALSRSLADHIRFRLRDATQGSGYNALQRVTYLLVVFTAFPMAIWTGLAMSPAFVSAFPMTVTTFGGQQSARTIHFFISAFLVLFLAVHIIMVCVAGFRQRMRAMITGHTDAHQERT